MVRRGLRSRITPVRDASRVRSDMRKRCRNAIRDAARVSGIPRDRFCRRGTIREPGQGRVSAKHLMTLVGFTMFGLLSVHVGVFQYKRGKKFVLMMGLMVALVGAAQYRFWGFHPWRASCSPSCCWEPRRPPCRWRVTRSCGTCPPRGKHAAPHEAKDLSSRRRMPSGSATPIFVIELARLCASATA